ncbi:hypothetical protein G6F57_001172 [Rhizopus arrhizus]|uniref:Metallo-beta-lactamase domain-containing protein n=1 Tax=Rhizopus oryzae TaxID=64495 RepID=A0A9P6X465_RHIOR|nr:hypothetical protein G6F24_009202 [Rhizopus arrhizus]KAG1417429.1 hypothetical protein G6F58_005524 [Rhizopus delemar]KAG0786718.1 hypothetical protein G6F21_008398 [Rhizopus arrhizus]KAG0808611.1 hypothetical protein G6F20_009437 [Rhizopus arrhizus]KAG0826716.1 hypothetical protein G6F19_009151 [Rhizopus arrhizus]
MSIFESKPRKDLPFLPDFCQLSDRVWRVMGLNPGQFTLQGTNTYLIGSGPRKVLIDCGDGQPGYVPLLAESLSKLGAYISDIFISHCHKDHWGGLDQLMASPINQREIKVHKFPLLVENPLQKHFGLFPDSIAVDKLCDNQIFQIDSTTHLHILYTPGHAKDHCSFYLPEENVVFTADCVLGHGTVAFEDLSEYIESLYRIHSLKPARLYPGHGEIIENAIERVEQYISIRLSKERQILDLMKNGSSWTPIELVENMSGASKGLSEDVMAVLVRTVGIHLVKLYHDGKAEMVDKESFQARTGIDPYNPLNAFSIVNQKWQLIAGSKL